MRLKLAFTTLNETPQLSIDNATAMGTQGQSGTIQHKQARAKAMVGRRLL
jgi:hypothetical protein